VRQHLEHLMKIGVLEWNIGARGGRQRTMLCFADFFLELGHQVTVYSDFLERDSAEPGYNADTFLSWYHFRHLEPRHVVWAGLERRYQRAEDLPPTWKDLDVLLVPYGGYAYLADMLPGVRVIAWVIHPDQARAGDCEVWTNSETTRERLLSSDRWANSDPKVVVAPHDYGIFRQQAQGWGDRYLDVITVGSMLRAKGLLEFTRMCLDLDLYAMILSSTWDAARDENLEMLAELAKLGVVPGQRRGSRPALMLNLPSTEVARYMGVAKVGVSLSRAESCPLTVYEFLNAGCLVATRRVGAVVEQTQCFGFYFNTDEQAPEAVRSALMKRPVDGDRHPESPSIGLRYDRTSVGHMVKEALE
jgi:hypothetical protein